MFKENRTKLNGRNHIAGGFPEGLTLPDRIFSRQLVNAQTLARGSRRRDRAPTSVDTVCLALGTFRPGASCVLVHILRAVWAWLSLAQEWDPRPISASCSVTWGRASQLFPVPSSKQPPCLVGVSP